MQGFFTPSAWTQKESLSLVPACGQCGLYQHCKSPKMPVTGEGRRRVLIVAEAPGENEDKRGIQLVGNTGMNLVRILNNIGVNMRRDCWLTNALICRPKDEKGSNRKPTTEELGFCRPNLIKTLNKLKPDVVITLGGPATASIMPLAWKQGEVEEITRWVGWRIPCQKLNTWICPTYHPSYLLHEKNPAAELHVARHLKAAFRLKDKPWPDGPPDYDHRVEVIMNSDTAADYISAIMLQGEPIAFDFETTTLKPDSKHAEIICCSVSNGGTTIACPWHGRAVEATKNLIQSDVPKIVANLRFEQRWCRKKLGCEVRNWHWDTVLGAHWRDCRRGIASLKFQAFVLLGTPDYDSHLDAYKESKDGNCNLPNRLKEVEPAVLMRYCGMDALLEVLVAQKQMEGMIL